MGLVVETAGADGACTVTPNVLRAIGTEPEEQIDNRHVVRKWPLALRILRVAIGFKVQVDFPSGKLGRVKVGSSSRSGKKGGRPNLFHEVEHTFLLGTGQVQVPRISEYDHYPEPCAHLANQHLVHFAEVRPGVTAIEVFKVGCILSKVGAFAVALVQSAPML